MWQIIFVLKFFNNVTFIHTRWWPNGCLLCNQDSMFCFVLFQTIVQLVIVVIIIILAICAALETVSKGQLLTFCAESSAWRVSDPCLEACGFPLTATCPSALYLIPCPRITSLGHWKMHQNSCLYWCIHISSRLYSSLELLFLPMFLWSLPR